MELLADKGPVGVGLHALGQITHCCEVPFSVTSVTFSYWVPKHQGTGDFMKSECMKLLLVLFTLIYTHCQLHVHLYCHLTLMFVQGTCA